MKKFLLQLFIIIFTIIGASVFGLQAYRYHINSPMADIEYKKAILRDSHNLTFTLEALRPIMGKEELAQFITANDNNPGTYTPDDINIKSGKFRANLHTHTDNSDGITTVEQRMNEAEEYAKNNIKDGYMLLAITDHNTVLGGKEIIKVLEKNKNKYKHLKIIPGIEIYTQYTGKYSDTPTDIHVLVWCINPYDDYLEKEFFKSNPNDKWNYKTRDFNQVISTMSNYGITGVAHPARYTTYLKEKKYPYITEMLTKYKELNNGISFTEGYYQPYKQTTDGKLLGKEYDRYIKYINDEAKKLEIIRTGSTDAHGKTIFGYK